jgi:hypothetical protein
MFAHSRRLVLHRSLRLAACSALAVASLGAAAVMPSTLRALGASYEALSVGTSTATALDLMGDPKTRAEHTVLGVRFQQMTWVDIAQVRYSAKFAADRLVHKSSSTIE